MCPSKMDRIMSCPLSMCPSVNFLCLLHNSDTVQEYFHETLYKYKPPSDDVQRIRTVIPFVLETSTGVYCLLSGALVDFWKVVRNKDLEQTSVLHISWYFM